MDGENLDENSSTINISDVIEVIETDPAFGSMDGGRKSSDPNAIGAGAYVQVLEQPIRALRFRYECEGRSAGSIPGINSSNENKTFPTIQIVGYKGRAVVVVSCVTRDAPYRPHPHNLVGKEQVCKKGVCTVEVNNDNMIVAFPNLGIQCVKKKDIEEALRVREEIRVDPFRTGFSHKTQASSIDLNSVRLCFQAFLEGPQRGKFTVPLKAVVSDPIYDKKAMSNLTICKMSHCSASVAGGNEIILLCEKVAKDDISVRFFEEKDGLVVWEGYGDFTSSQVHKQVAIALRTPRYRTLEVDQPVQAQIQLRRPSDKATSEALPFQLTPLDSDPAMLKRKRQKFSNSNEVIRQIQETERIRLQVPESSMSTVKREPDSSPNPYGAMYGGGIMVKPSPTYVSRTPSPLDYAGIAFQQGQQVHAAAGTSSLPYSAPSYSQFLPPVSSATVPATELFNLDTQQYSVDLNLNSKELVDLDVALDGNLSANLSNSLSLADNGSRVNMTDSLTRLATSRFEELMDIFPNNQ